MGQAVWLDFVERKFLQSGGLRELVAVDGVTGVTSNPSIFEKAMAQGTAYDPGFREQMRNPAATAEELYEGQAILDIKAAAADLRPVYDRLGGKGWLRQSRGVAPPRAARARDDRGRTPPLKLVGEPNLMIKVPGTAPGAQAVRVLIEEGINVNVTLLFSMEAYRAVAVRLHGRSRSPARQERAHRPHRQRRELLRQPHRQPDRQEDRRPRRGRVAAA